VINVLKSVDIFFCELIKNNSYLVIITKKDALVSGS
jgi:hypothetical protein